MILAGVLYVLGVFYAAAVNQGIEDHPWREALLWPLTGAYEIVLFLMSFREKKQWNYRSSQDNPPP